MWNDFKPKFKWKLERTFWLHLAREFVIAGLLSYISVAAAIWGGTCFNSAWEWQDGLKGDGFNGADWLAGCLGILLALIVRGEIW